MGDGLRVIASDPWCRRILLLIAAAFSLVLIPETLVATYADETFPTIEGATGALAALTAVGVIIATLVNGRMTTKVSSVTRRGSSSGGSPRQPGVLRPRPLRARRLGYLAIGPVLAIRVHAYTVLSRRIEDVLLAPAMSVAGGVLAVSYLVAGLGGGTLADAIGAGRTFAIAAGLAALVGAASLLVPVQEKSSA